MKEEANHVYIPTIGGCHGSTADQFVSMQPIMQLKECVPDPVRWFCWKHWVAKEQWKDGRKHRKMYSSRKTHPNNEKG